MVVRIRGVLDRAACGSRTHAESGRNVALKMRYLADRVI